MKARAVEKAKAASQAAPRGAVAAGDAPSEKAKRAEDAAAMKARAVEKAKAASQAAPRGAVAAGEAPASSNGVAPLAGTAAGAMLLAGAGTFVIRRRSAARANG
ncbi:sortase-dependent protein [Streptomyces sp. NPDC088124]|uniref:sortase-dependent protein n=1 Tax=Streptomyces sp. NPDC088124 TaxID=3154654 RepID=UPI0034444D6B